MLNECDAWPRLFGCSRRLHLGRILTDPDQRLNSQTLRSLSRMGI